jgi:hypothetical protein
VACQLLLSSLEYGSCWRVKGIPKLSLEEPINRGGFERNSDLAGVLKCARIAHGLGSSRERCGLTIGDLLNGVARIN